MQKYYNPPPFAGRLGHVRKGSNARNNHITSSRYTRNRKNTTKIHASLRQRNKTNPPRQGATKLPAGPGRLRLLFNGQHPWGGLSQAQLGIEPSCIPQHELGRRKGGKAI